MVKIKVYTYGKLIIRFDNSCTPVQTTFPSPNPKPDLTHFKSETVRAFRQLVETLNQKSRYLFNTNYCILRVLRTSVLSLNNLQFTNLGKKGKK